MVTTLEMDDQVRWCKSDRAIPLARNTHKYNKNETHPALRNGGDSAKRFGLCWLITSMVSNVFLGVPLTRSELELSFAFDRCSRSKPGIGRASDATKSERRRCM